jgi:hypothetical protein
MLLLFWEMSDQIIIRHQSIEGPSKSDADAGREHEAPTADK